MHLLCAAVAPITKQLSLPLALTTSLHEAAGICADDSSGSKPILAKCVVHAVARVYAVVAQPYIRSRSCLLQSLVEWRLPLQ